MSSQFMVGATDDSVLLAFSNYSEFPLPVALCIMANDQQ